MRFTWSNIAYLLPALLLTFAVWSLRSRSFFGHSLLAYLRARIGPPPLQIYLPRVFEFAGLACLCVALLNPVTPLTERSVNTQGLNMVLVVDLSSSMQMPVSGGRRSPTGRVETRLEAVKSALIDFIGRRKADRIGVIVFSNNAYVVTPMTTDYAYLINYIQMINDRTLMDEGMTAIGEGLLLARDMLLRDAGQGTRRGNVIVLLTDGENNTGRPVDIALQQVRESGMKTYFIGVEVVLGTTVENQGFNEAPILIRGVRDTGGKYFDARDAGQLNQAYREINALEKGRFLTKEHLRDVPAFAPFAIAAVVLIGAGLLLRTVPQFRELS
jgi:Ca-activated chloride channel family protein